jgi:hypothetical protein
MPIQVVKPSVSFAAVLQGTALTISVEIPSFPTLDSPVVEFGSRGLPGAGTAPVGAGTAGGGGGKALGTCCAKHADPANVSVIAKRKNDRFMASLPSYNASLRQRLILFNWTDDFGSTIIPDLMQTVKLTPRKRTQDALLSEPRPCLSSCAIKIGYGRSANSFSTARSPDHPIF